ncbi:xanthine and CO dehydrogenase family maturation factor XdhC/CoxF family protein [Shewanella hanedai]|uniref:XdhC/CoxI family protein n=1 Tax=Shewanella hanedai TaxID=25 RepID=A0A553JKC4_SHEHA|nr:XdhC/CoxI family protein [Shewanella hanedai]TRY12909.1 XdhC/CoxI family protein [Shewanella hanedai]GGI92166.1 xanthine and CO dehydrogenase family maturation factor XdhC/CoxF family protein [Shewanella hanedai]
MSHHIEDILSQWQVAPHDEWVLAVITKVQGSSYRKTGAMMLFHPLGRSVGLLSGGCLEADLRRHAQMAIEKQQAILVQYDASDETDASYQLGCGGIVDIMLVPLKRENHYLHFHQLTEQLYHGGQFFYQIALPRRDTDLANIKASIHPYDEAPFPVDDFKRAGIFQSAQDELVIPLRSRYRLAIFGGGLDAQPLVAMALNLGWQVDLIDERASYARNHDFPGARVYKQPVDSLPEGFERNLDAIIIMQHNLTLDAKALRVAQEIDKAGYLRYLGLLGPPHRRERVLEKSELKVNDFNCFFSAPAGFALGGELPESVALSILAQCHGVLHGARQTPLDQVMI